MGYVCLFVFVLINIFDYSQGLVFLPEILIRYLVIFGLCILLMLTCSILKNQTVIYQYNLLYRKRVMLCSLENLLAVSVYGGEGGFEPYRTNYRCPLFKRKEAYPQ